MSASATIGAYARLGRLSNSPTCLSNVLVGCAIGGLSDPASWTTVALMTGAIVLLYVAGMALNDAVDHRVDRRQRPGRPIPSGQVSVAVAIVFAASCLGLGLAVMALAGVPTLATGGILVATIVVYDLVHQRLAASVVLMGACRGLVYLAAAAAVAWPLDWPVAATLAGAMTVYVTTLTAIARGEAVPAAHRRNVLSLGLPLIALAPMALPGPWAWGWLPATAAIIVVAWLAVGARHALARPTRMRDAVHGWLAGICLVDALYLTLLDQPVAALVAVGCFGVTVIAQRYILGT